MNMAELMAGLQICVRAFEDPLFLSFTALIAFAVGVGVKRLFLE